MYPYDPDVICLCPLRLGLLCPGGLLDLRDFLLLPDVAAVSDPKNIRCRRRIYMRKLNAAIECGKSLTNAKLVLLCIIGKPREQFFLAFFRDYIYFLYMN